MCVLVTEVQPLKAGIVHRRGTHSVGLVTPSQDTESEGDCNIKMSLYTKNVPWRISGSASDPPVESRVSAVAVTGTVAQLFELVMDVEVWGGLCSGVCVLTYGLPKPFARYKHPTSPPWHTRTDVID